MPPKQCPEKIAIVVRDTVGGICRYSHELANALASHGVAVTLLCKPDFPSYEHAAYARRPILNSTMRIGKKGAGVRLFNKVSLLLEHTTHPIQAFRYCNSNSIHWIHFSNSFHLGYLLWNLFRKRHYIIGLTVHDIRRKSAGLAERILNHQLKKLYRSASILFVHDSLSAEEVSKLTNKGHERIYVVPHGSYKYNRTLTPPREAPKRLNKVKTGLFFGAIRDEKRLDLLIKALACRREQRNWRLLVAGSSSGEHHKPTTFYQDLAHSLGVLDRVEFHARYIPDEEVFAYFEAADWVSLIYDKSFTSQSGVLATAVNFKVPILTAGAPLLMKTVQQYEIGINCESDEPHLLLKAIEQIESLPVYQSAEKFDRLILDTSWSKNAQTTLEAYRQKDASQN